MRQYSELKNKYADAILFFRLGDFYEMFLDDAVVASKILNITLTARNKESNVPLCGVPHHSAQIYLKRLLDAGFKVAICEQLEDPAKAKGIVKRDVVRVLTPGTIADIDVLDPRENNYLMAVTLTNSAAGVSFADISTGEFFTAELAGGETELIEEIRRVSPKELLVSAGFETSPLIKKIKDGSHDLMITIQDPARFTLKSAKGLLLEHFQISNLHSFGIENMPLAVSAAGAVLGYLIDTQKGNIKNINSPRTYTNSDSMIIDEATRRNLEIFSNISRGSREESLIEIIDLTSTPMGARELKKWLLFPLQDRHKITERQDAIEEICLKPLERRGIIEILCSINDIERLLSRTHLGSVTPRELVSLRESLQNCMELKKSLRDFSSPFMSRLKEDMADHSDLIDYLKNAIEDSPPQTIKDCGVIKQGFNKELDELRSISREGEKWMVQLEVKERSRTGIGSLKVRYNRVFGYYIDVTRANLHLVPQDYIRKQSLANSERFITQELKEFEEKIVNANERIIQLESTLFDEIRKKITEFSAPLKYLAGAVANIDVIASCAAVAVKRNYCRPRFTDRNEIVIKDGRHPVIESHIQKNGFVPNDAKIDTEENQILIITGPNMAGKSTVIRQVGLIVLLAHTGSFVPAAEVSMGIVDRIFARVGAMDELARGRSTFMVEMNETAYILRHATERSLILLDEIGRGTATFDGISIAWAVAEYIHEKIGAKTLFATHYHELTELAITKPRIKNFTISVREWNEKIIFLRKLVPGGASRSFGIQVGKLAGLPLEVVERAKEILANLEKGEFDSAGKPRIAKNTKEGGQTASQMTFFSGRDLEVIEELKKIAPEAITPIEALQILNSLKKKLKD